MKVVIFAGGLGTRLMEETEARPKPMVEIGGKPILWHIMKIYEAQGFNEFILCLGYKGYMIKEYFYHYFIHHSNLTIEIKNNQIQVHNSKSEDFKITLIDTGLNTKTAGRLQLVKDFIDTENFMLTYGDGLCTVDLKSLIQFHQNHGKIATVTAIQMEQKFGGLIFDNDGKVSSFKEKSKDGHKWINGGYFILNKKIFNYLTGDCKNMMWEDEPLEKLTQAKQLQAFKHYGFWKCMDALRDKIELEELWNSPNPAWKIW